MTGRLRLAPTYLTKIFYKLIKKLQPNCLVLEHNAAKYPAQELFYTDALVFKDLASTSISILSHKTSHGITVLFNGFPYMGFWNAKDADFVCIEPWCGIADSVDSTMLLSEKEGINQLEPNAIFSRTWTVETF